MSPLETPVFPSKGVHTDTSPLSLQDYAVTSNGFLPEEPPLRRLPDPYYAPWESLVETLSTSIAEQTLRQQVDQLPVLSTDRLTTEPEWRRACVVLAFLTHGYIWGGETAAEILPPPLTTPLLTITTHLGMPPVATYACVNLWNFHQQHPLNTTSPASPASPSPPSAPTNLDALTALHTFTGTPDESWFYMVSVAMEARGAYLVPAMLRTLEAATSARVGKCGAEVVADGLGELAAGIGELGGLLDRMDERCDPMVFYHRIRPFLAGSKNMAAAGLPRGVFYDGGEGVGEWRQLRGGSNGQSSLVQFLDVVLGVEHKAMGNSSPDSVASSAKVGGESFHQEVRRYMPEPHRRFLEDVAVRYPGGMRKAVGDLVADGTGGSKEELMAVREAFEGATRALAEFRNKHLQMVTRYIIIPSRQPNPNQGVNLATASSRLTGTGAPEGRRPAPTAGGELTGTGGTALLPFLKQSRDETFQAGQLRVR
ncbi:Indoleamine 2,3-dioxygenase [Chaetomium tenue]|uniref:Indoleamine 2,3-dioxygenase n=1 Tax=Chaetomium tenue TaxID=1854479 RepID=A0ACB7P0K5_9PEZI|nr:Indoleamine 2,3-dioxygenase [Chaetomium globosum]